jgi:hypothetical protein
LPSIKSNWRKLWWQSAKTGLRKRWLLFFNREPHEPRENFLTRIARIDANTNALKALRKSAQGWRAATTLGKARRGRIVLSDDFPAQVLAHGASAHQRRADLLYAFSVFEFVFASSAWFAVHLIRLPATFSPARRRNFLVYLNSHSFAEFVSEPLRLRVFALKNCVLHPGVKRLNFQT